MARRVPACHRVELYAALADAKKAEGGLRRFLARERGLAVAEFAPYLFCLVGREAVEDVLPVACGLDSMVVGEPQILGQA